MAPMSKLTFRDESACRFDFLALGALVQRFDPGLIPLHEASHFERHCSGAEYNPAANLAKCFGLRAAVASAIAEYPPGWWIETEVRRAGVIGCYKRFAFDGVRGPRMANTYSDRGMGVRAPEVWYDRANEAGSLLAPGDFDWRQLFESDGVRWFHSGGIFAALSPSTSALILEGMKAARASGAVVSYDLNFRRRLWDASPGGSARAVDVNRGIVACADVLIGNEEDLQLGLGITGPEVSSSRQSSLDAASFRVAIDRARKQFPNLKVIATTLREVHSASRHSWKALLWYDGEFQETPTLDLDVHDRIGGGDGFAAGLIFGLLTGESPEMALRLGWAHGALLTTYPGDITMARLDQVRALAQGSGARVVR